MLKAFEESQFTRVTDALHLVFKKRQEGSMNPLSMAYLLSLRLETLSLSSEVVFSLHWSSSPAGQLYHQKGPASSQVQRL